MFRKRKIFTDRRAGLPREIKVAWAASLSALVGMLILMEVNGETALRPVINTLIDMLQDQECSPGTREVPPSTGPLDLPPRDKVLPRAEDSLAG